MRPAELPQGENWYGEQKIIQSQGTVKEVHFESREIDILKRSQRKNEILTATINIIVFSQNESCKLSFSITKMG